MTNPTGSKDTTSRLHILQHETVAPTEIPPRLYLSHNSKTGYSVNTAIALTCRPTRLCRAYCYGLEGRIRMAASLRRQTENFTRFEFLDTAPQETVDEEAARLAGVVLRRQNFLRFFGVGDLQLGSVRLINTLAAATPGLALWVSSRIPALAAELQPMPNLHVMLSLDGSTPPRLRERLQVLAEQRSPGFFLAWMQSAENEPAPSGVRVVFAEHHLAQRAVWTASDADPRTCPATSVIGIPHARACERCRFCFDAARRTKPGPVPLRLKRRFIR